MIKKYIIKGLVQGIGYRPFVAKLAEELNIDGYVRNTGGIVTVVACGETEKLDQFRQKLSSDVPTGGFITSIEEEEIESHKIERQEIESQKIELGFRIIESDKDAEKNLPLIPADIATCDKCKAELFDKKNRRYGHPFISCTVCGPRYSIIEKLPYDRDTITMKDFEMCPECQTEYIAKNDRRRHAQTIACKECGPRLKFASLKCKNADNITSKNIVDKYVENYNENDIDGAITASISLISRGGILAIKDIGGYHLACSPFDEKAVAALRTLKHREAKAFAVMFEDIKQIKEYCKVNQQEARLLESPARPIVLVRRKKHINSGSKHIAGNVYLTSPDIGAMLPCNPVQMMLVKECGPLIMTSGNASGDVLEIDNKRMQQWLKERVESGDLEDTPIALLSHDRKILRPMDDSVMKVIKGRQQFVRRGRGHVPNPIPVDIDGEIFAAGGDLKSSFCYVKNGMAYVSQYLGDLESVSCQKFYRNEMAAMEKIFGFKPKTVVTDLHPGYFSGQVGHEYAQKKNLPIHKVQHHKAHVLSVIVEHNLKGPVLGFAFDGTGYGEDGTVWGSEVFLWDGKNALDRVADLRPARLIGGDEGAKNCDTILVGILHENGLDELIENENAKLIRAAIDSDINVVTSTSMGRLFDAVSAMLDICHYNTYEGQAPIELENMAARTDQVYPLCFGENGSTEEIFIEIANAIFHDVSKESIARGFIYAVADYILEIAKIYSERLGKEKQIVLSGGTFLNRILLERSIDLLESEGFKVYISEQLPPGDGGICLGQAAFHLK
ncbi:hydrogenase maturation protein HypF [Pseudobutyrivibrio sp. UC1225]|uniref:carbamoyltransferase HypF n=1 Tax=Pseudobutyrivibrio sp. UC1225 TaxID=1798185 RepID=UPI0008F33F96|nr:carbamoyltransferase HypF [Pseudobutyrivibrio sp. UC1225]SFO11240.1 hydrogenase maturation protein HypF [Pseudobutyrivibrio sp. UC1225]